MPVDEEHHRGKQHEFQRLRERVLLHSLHRRPWRTQNNFIGQALAGTATIGNQFTMTYKAVLVPGQGTVSGFSQDIAYVREI